MNLGPGPVSLLADLTVGEAITAADCKLGKVTKKKGVTTKTGKVVKQSPKVGRTAPAGSKVTVTLG
jgi:beta-lactam-binding protein with PASTA domain